MKKLCFLLLPALLLTSCSSGEPISYEEAQRKYYEEIGSTTTDRLLELGKARITIKTKYTYDGDPAQNGSHKYVFDYSKEKQFAHSKLTRKGIVYENWVFVKDGKLYSAIRQKSADSDYKYYITEPATGTIEDDYYVASIIDFMGNNLKIGAFSFLNTVGEKGSYFSSGEGGLEMSFNGKIEHDDIYERINSKYVFENGIMMQAKVNYHSNGFITNLGQKVYIKHSTTETYKLTKREVVKYPDLSVFEQGVS